VQRGDWLTLHWQQANWLEKPPLTFWVMAGLFHVFGISEFSARAVSALADVGVVAVIYGIGKLQRGPVCGWIAALILLDVSVCTDVAPRKHGRFPPVFYLPGDLWLLTCEER
jgi:4-amino-4-deoxy-L-arabinose transferase-like glycosyltransferase